MVVLRFEKSMCIQCREVYRYGSYESFNISNFNIPFPRSPTNRLFIYQFCFCRYRLSFSTQTISGSVAFFSSSITFFFAVPYKSARYSVLLMRSCFHSFRIVSFRFVSFRYISSWFALNMRIHDFQFRCISFQNCTIKWQTVWKW